MSDSSAAFLLILCAFAGHRYSVRSGLLRGTTPWHIPSVVWAVLCLATGPFGLLVEFVAVRTTKPVSLSAAGDGHPGPAEWGPVTPTAFGPTPPPERPLVPAADDGSGKMALFGWYPDPSGRHERRYWDGKGWTRLIEDHLVTGDDPL
jgi:hypothetical protein